MEFSNSSGHTTICQTGFFFYASGHTTVSKTGLFLTPVPYHSLSDRVFLKNILDLDVNDYTTISQTGSVVWSQTSYVKKVTEKKPWSVRPWSGH